MGLTVQRRQARLRAPLLLWGRPDRLHTAPGSGFCPGCLRLPVTLPAPFPHRGGVLL